MNKLLDKVKIGTSSFSESDWVGPFYPPGIKPSDYLTFYARRFRTVEIDATYYAIPSSKAVDNWVRKTPENFLISAKFPRSIVHAGKGPIPDKGIILNPDKTYADRDKFLERMNRLGSRLGPLVLQFPYFSKKIFASPKEFLERLERFLEDLSDDFSYAVEIRNRHWLTGEFHGLLNKHNVALVLVDQAWMPHGDEVEKMFDPVTGDFVYVRLLGDRKGIEAITETWDRIVVDQSEKLRRWAALIERLLERDETILLYANNHYAGHAPETVRQLEHMLGLTAGD